MIAVKCINSNSIISMYESQDSAVGVVISNGLDSWGSIPDRRKRFSQLHSIQTSSGPHPASCPMGTKGSFPRGKAAKA
jgi:hypothetical protein